MNRSLKALSLNINGCRNKEKAIDDLLQIYDVMFIQEHMLSGLNTNFLNRSRSHDVFIQPARSTAGRPSGGLAIYARKELSAKPSIRCSNLLCISAEGIEFINVYMPTNYNNAVSLTKFSKAADALGRHLESLERSGSKWLIAGDLNCDPTKDHILSDIFLNCLPTSYNIWPKSLDFTYTHTSGHTSNIDHVLSSTSIPGLPVTVCTDDPISDHAGISFHLHSAQSTNNACSRRWVYKQNWQKCNIALYIATVASVLSCIKVPFHLLCTGPSNMAASIELNTYYHQVTHALKAAESKAVPTRRVKIGTEKPMWSESIELQTAKRRAKMWLNIWIACGRPLRGTVFELKRSTKRKYKAEMKKYRIIGQQFTENKKSWRSLIRPDDRAPNTSLTLHDWHSYYTSVYGDENLAITNQYEKEVTSWLARFSGQRCVVPISLEKIKIAVKKALSKGKNGTDGDGLTTKHLKHLPESFYSHLQLIFQMCITRGFVPNSFLKGVITSIAKKGKDPNDCKSYRPITVSCILSKVFEYVIFSELDTGDFGDNQLGFQKGLGCPEAHRLLANVLMDSERNKSPLYMCTIDISKAFDSVNHMQAMNALLLSGVSASIVKTLKFWYENSIVSAKWKDRTSDPAKIKRGVRQGSVLSPLIFKHAISKILDRISPSLLLHGTDLSYLAYADDVLLLSRSKADLQDNLSRLHSDFLSIGLSINIEKCEFLTFNAPKSESVTLGNHAVPAVSELRYLGIMIAETIGKTRQSIVKQTTTAIKRAYGSVVPNRGRYSRKSLASIYRSVCQPHVIYLAGASHVLTVRDCEKIRKCYYKYAKFLLYISKRYRNSRLEKYGLPEPSKQWSTIRDNSVFKVRLMRRRFSPAFV